MYCVTSFRITLFWKIYISVYIGIFLEINYLLTLNLIIITDYPFQITGQQPSRFNRFNWHLGGYNCTSDYIYMII